MTIPAGTTPTGSMPNSILPIVSIVGADHVVHKDGEWIVRPGLESEVAAIVKVAFETGLRIMPLGTRANAKLEDNVISLELGRLQQIFELDTKSMLVHVGAGLTGYGLERILLSRGFSLGDYPPAMLRSSLGGMVSVRTPGKSSIRHGFFEDAVMGVSYVLSDGRLVVTPPVPRRAMGADPTRAILGSEGNFAVITSLVLRMHRKPETRRFSAFRLPSLSAAVSAIYLAFREEISPSGLRVYDAAAARFHFYEIDIKDDEALIVMTSAGLPALAECDEALMASSVIANGGRVDDASFAELWWKRLYALEPTPVSAPEIQLTATPRRLVSIYQKLQSQAVTLDISLRVHISRFDRNGGILLVTANREFSKEERSSLIAAAVEEGGVAVGIRAPHLTEYENSLKSFLDPRGVFVQAKR